MKHQNAFKRCSYLGEGVKKVKLATPFIIVNFKTYDGCFGKEAVRLARIVEKVAKQTGASLAVAPNNIDIYRVSQSVSIPVLAQHVSPIEAGSHTGHVLAQAVREAGASGTLLNHAEKMRSVEVIGKSIARCREAGLVTVVCADTVDSIREIAGLRPDVLAIEPPELIGGGISVTTADPGLLKRSLDAVKRVADIPVLCGAGVKTGDDVAAALRLGMRGVLLASGVTRADNPEKALLGLVRGLQA